MPCLLVVLFLLLSVPASAAPTSPDARAIGARFGKWVQPLIDLDVFQGTVLFARGGRVVYTQGFGSANLELGVPNSRESAFRIASLSKVATEVAIGKLIDDGRLRLEDPLSRFLPDFPRAGEITIEQLLVHRAGIPNLNSIPFDEEAPGGTNTLDSLVRKIAGRPLDFAPGSARRYSNGGYAVLAKVIERASGVSFPEYMQRAVFAPLGMTRTRHEEDGSLVPHRSSGSMARPDRRHGQMLPPYQQMVTKQGGGSLVSTVDDLDKLLRAMYRENAIHAGTWWKLFPRTDSTSSFQGRCPGYNLWMIRDFEHDAEVVMLANNYSCGMAADIGQALLEIGLGGSPVAPAWRADVPADSARSARYVGTYRAPARALPYGEGPFEVRWKDGELLLLSSGTPVDCMLPQPDGSFLLRTYWSVLTFPPGEGPSPSASFRPLWFETDAVVAPRIETAPH